VAVICINESGHVIISNSSIMIKLKSMEKIVRVAECYTEHDARIYLFIHSSNYNLACVNYASLKTFHVHDLLHNSALPKPLHTQGRLSLIREEKLEQVLCLAFQKSTLLLQILPFVRVRKFCSGREIQIQPQ